MTKRIGIVDLFSGPGGLSEGFSSIRDAKGDPIFEIDASVESDGMAHRTLRLRSFLRKVPGGFPTEYYDWINGLSREPDWARLWPREWEAANRECQNLELGTNEARDFFQRRIPEIRALRGDATVLIGGPPCQAYSLAGRGRKASRGYAPHPKDRHLLYREYIEVLRALRPAAFVMENVKGLLSSQADESRIVEEVLSDLRQGGGAASYVVFPIAPQDQEAQKAPRPIDFVVHAERHGVPQARHRVIIVGLRADVVASLPDGPLPILRPRAGGVSVADVISGLPVLRSGLSYRAGEVDSFEAWSEVVRAAGVRIRHYAGRQLGTLCRQEFVQAIEEALASARSTPQLGRIGSGVPGVGPECPPDLAAWLLDKRVVSASHHETRAHMPADLERYLFVAAWSRATGESPKARLFPKFLAPSHESWGSGFADRFRVQSAGRPSSTITCHISKDGHYFIHPDPAQVRSLTVREAARLQTFPDNYFFAGNRTQAYVQVGNAVPPFLARQIGEALAPALVSALASRHQGEADYLRLAV